MWPTRKVQSPKRQFFTEEDICSKANELWKSRNGAAGSAEDDWNAAIKALKKERSPRGRILAPFIPFWRWTGFGEKKLWDFLQLLLVPLLLAGAGFALQEYGKQREKVAADEKAYQDTWTKYLDTMEKELDAGLLTKKPGDKTFIIAQARTVTALQSLDPVRQHLVIQFLEAANLNSLATNGLLYQAHMSKAKLAKSDFSGIKLEGANLKGANLKGADLSGADLKGAQLFAADFEGADLRGANLRGADIEGTSRDSTYLSEFHYGFEISITGPGSSGTRLFAVNLKGARLFAADLRGANLRGAYLRGANLSEADFRGADLRGADLRGADLSYACLKQAENLTTPQVKSAQDWEDAYYSPDFRKQLGLGPEISIISRCTDN